MPAQEPTKAVYLNTGAPVTEGWTIAPYHTVPGLERLYQWHEDVDGEEPPFASQEGKPGWKPYEGDTRPGAV